MDVNNHLERLDDARTQYHWAIANIVLALLCTVLAGTVFMFGYVVAGVLIIAVSVALVVNSDTNKKRGDVLAREA